MIASTAPPSRSSGPRVSIVGGGVIGVCCAYFLARRGADVTVLERDEVGQGASFGNAGLISPGHPPINRPGRVRQALRSMLDPLSPLYLEPRWDRRLAGWLWSFSRHCTAEHVEHGMSALSPLGLATVDLFDHLLAEEDLDCDYRRSGYLEVFDTPAGLKAGEEEAAVVTRHGFSPDRLEGAALREREPLLADSVLGGWHHPEGRTVDPYRFVMELAARAALHGAVIREDTGVGAILTESGRVLGVRTVAGEEMPADVVVLSTGAYSPELMASLGCPLPIQPAKGYHSDRDPAAPGSPHPALPCLLGERSVFCSPFADYVRLAGTLEFSGRNLELRRDRLDQLDAAARRYFRDVRPTEALSEWCGLRPCTPDGLPVVGPVPGYRGAFVATGHAMLGLTLGPVTGSMIADLVLEGAASIPVGSFAAERFGRTPART